MKVNRLGDKFTCLEKSQMLKIDELQEKIKLLEFDRSKDRAIIYELKSTILRNKKSINEVIKEIKEIQRQQNYSKLNYITKILEMASRDLEIIKREGDIT